MARNPERDAREAENRRKRLLDAGFQLFSENSIEAVSLQSVAEAADVGVATLYNYYQNKLNLVVAISAQVWKDVIITSEKTHSAEERAELDVFSLTEFFMDEIIELYKKHPRVLRFSSNYKTYIRSEKATDEQLKLQFDALKEIEKEFHVQYLKAIQEGTIRTDCSESKLYTTITITILSMAERYAMGIVWNDDHEAHVEELNLLKNMLLEWMKAKK